MLRHMRVWRYLDAVARAGSVRAAAEHLNVTPSALLRRIQDVEEDLGEALFERTGSGMILTAAGDLFIAWIRSQNAELQHVQSQIDEIAGVRRGTVRAVCSQAVAESFFPDQIARFQKRHADVNFEVCISNYDDAMRRLSAYQADLALVFGSAIHPDLEALVAVDQRLVAVMAEDHPLACHTQITLDQCLRYGLALLDRTHSGRRLIDSAAAALPIAMRVVLESNSFEMLCEFVAATDAVTFQAQIGTSGLAQRQRLAVRPIGDTENMCAKLVLLHLKGRALPLAATRFADQLVGAMGRSEKQGLLF